MITVTRHHDFCYGHRVVDHESKCRHLHGHNGRIHFTIRAADNKLDSIGRVIDFSVIKRKLCQWVEDVIDHSTLIWSKDPLLTALRDLDRDGIFEVSFNPTAENICRWFVEDVGPRLLDGTGCELIECTLEETRKCKATFTKD
jgi:putative 6-pyruvoyl tetrahydrobiopterin synthase (PTPS)(PTP synthase)|uniref:6-pyruvoyl tetrahydropterin synthase n=1 Tax=Siphoviridae sp. ctJ7x27 TaxID=2827835 RepID=A0A8S5S3X6_9CAUD|nr:MAG TPA: 6-pyruvoyl tetrahydropterin synthase [Siphoviridae sp. ctJ7x27]